MHYNVENSHAELTFEWCSFTWKFPQSEVHCSAIRGLVVMDTIQTAMETFYGVTPGGHFVMKLIKCIY